MKQMARAWRVLAVVLRKVAHDIAKAMRDSQEHPASAFPEVAGGFSRIAEAGDTFAGKPE